MEIVSQCYNRKDELKFLLIRRLQCPTWKFIMKIFVTCWSPPQDIWNSGMNPGEEIFRLPFHSWPDMKLTLLLPSGCRTVRGGHQVCRGGDETPAEGEQGEDPGAHSCQQDQLQVARAAHGERD